MPEGEKGWVYILQRSDGKYYVGSTKNLIERIERHVSWRVLSTKGFRPLKLVAAKQFDSIKEARRIEIQLKKYKRRGRIQEVIRKWK